MNKFLRLMTGSSMSLKKFEDFYLAFLWIAAILILYAPLILKGGIIIDDWGGLASNFQCESIFNACFIERYLDAFYAVFANRPLAPLPIVLSTVLFKTHFEWYLYANTTIYLISILITAWVIHKLAGKIAALIFSYVAVIPFISMPLVVSPINLMDSTLAYLFWSISFYLLYKFCIKRSYIGYVISYLLLVFGFFTYEVFLPLLTMNALMPCMVDKEVLKTSKIKYICLYIFPLIIVLAIVYLWQKVLGPHLYEFHSRLNFSWSNVIPSFLSWAGIFFYDVPMLFYKSRKYLSPALLFGSIFFVISIACSWSLLAKINKNSNTLVFRYFLISSLCFLGSSLILILSGAKADVGGYDSRALSSIWICFAIFCSGLSIIIFKIRQPILRRLIGGLSLAILCLCCLSFLIQRDNYVKSWAIQTLIIDDALSLISKSELEKSSTIIANVPQHLPKNYNNELIFNTYWDFTAALQVFTNRLVKGGPVIDAQAGNFHNLRIINGVLLIDGLKINNFEKFWFYDFDQNSRKGSLLKISNTQELKKKLSSLGNPTYLGELGQNSAVERGEVLEFSQDWINRHHFIKNGFSERESWGVWSSGAEADLVLPSPVGGAAGLRLDVRAFIVPKNPEQRIEISVNDLRLEPITLSKFNGNQIDIPISASISNKENSIRIHFKFLNAVSPKQLGIGADERTIAIGLERAIFY